MAVKYDLNKLKKYGKKYMREYVKLKRVEFQKQMLDILAGLK